MITPHDEGGLRIEDVRRDVLGKADHRFPQRVEIGGELAQQLRLALVRGEPPQWPTRTTWYRAREGDLEAVQEADCTVPSRRTVLMRRLTHSPG